MLERVQAFIDRHQLLSAGDTVVVAVSGGPDSVCLLHLLLRLSPSMGLLLHVAHLDHQLRPESGQEARFVQELAVEWDLPVTVDAVDVAALAAEGKLSIEEAARHARYQFLTQVAGRLKANRIALGHNADDQAETVLMHLLRGTGLAGLRGMRPSSLVGDRALSGEGSTGLYLIRPLLETNRAAIEAYCCQEGLEPQLDQSNTDPRFFRNRLRHEVLPYLDELQPGMAGRLRQLASIVVADYDLLQEVLDETWPQLIIDESDRAVIFDLSKWRDLSLSLRRMTLRRAVLGLRHSLRDLSFEHVEAARRLAESAETGAKCTLPGHLQLSISYHRLIVAECDYVLPPPANWPLLLDDRPVHLQVPGRTILPGTDWALEIESLRSEPANLEVAQHNQDEWSAWMDADSAGTELSLSPRLPGQRFQPLGMGGQSISISDYMINQRIPAAWRNRIPIICRPDRPVWVAGWRLDQRVCVTNQTRQLLRLVFVPIRPLT